MRNVRLCEACGYEFEDTVQYCERELADADQILVSTLATRRISYRSATNLTVTIVSTTLPCLPEITSSTARVPARGGEARARCEKHLGELSRL